MLGNLFAQPISMSSLVYLLVWSHPPNIPYISSSNQCLLFAAHAHTIATCFAVVPRLYYLFLVCLSFFLFRHYGSKIKIICWKTILLKLIIKVKLTKLLRY